jgi:hypothetical protein
MTTPSDPRGPWIQCRSGARFYPFAPLPLDVPMDAVYV